VKSVKCELYRDKLIRGVHWSELLYTVFPIRLIFGPLTPKPTGFLSTLSPIETD